MFINNVRPISTKKIVLTLLDKLIFEQEALKQQFGSNFTSLFTETVELIKNNAMFELKYDYDYLVAQLVENAKEIPELRKLLMELVVPQTSDH